MLASRMGAAISATIKSFAPAPGQTITDATLEQMWTAVSQDIIDEIKENMDIEFDAADISVPGLGLFDSIPLPVTGAAASAATGPLSGKVS